MDTNLGEPETGVGYWKIWGRMNVIKLQMYEVKKYFKIQCILIVKTEC